MTLSVQVVYTQGMTTTDSNRVGTMVPTFSTNMIKAGDLRADVMGVHWTDTGWTECREHLLNLSWAAAITGDDEPTGIALYGEVACDACGERD